jgi:hypothetical protein
MMSLLACLLFALSGASREDQLIRQILTEAKVPESFRTSMRMQAGLERKKRPEIPASTWLGLDSLIAALPVEDRLVAQWRGQFSVPELQQILAFWKTPTGKKYFRVEQTLNARQGAIGALLGFDVYEFLSQRHPAQFPVDRRAREATIRQFQSILQGPR